MGTSESPEPTNLTPNLIKQVVRYRQLSTKRISDEGYKAKCISWNDIERLDKGCADLVCRVDCFGRDQNCQFRVFHENSELKTIPSSNGRFIPMAVAKERVGRTKHEGQGDGKYCQPSYTLE